MPKTEVPKLEAKAVGMILDASDRCILGWVYQWNNSEISEFWLEPEKFDFNKGKYFILMK